MAEQMVRLPVDFFKYQIINGLLFFDKEYELLLLYLKLYFTAEEKRVTRGRYYFSLGYAEITDHIIETCFDLKHFSGREATDLLEKFGLIKREKTRIYVNPFWTSERETSSPEYSFWKNSVLERDGYTCRECGSTENIQAHHIVPWKDCKRKEHLRFDVDNGITLCRSCHLKAHKGCWKNG